MISANDTTIVALLARLGRDMPAAEADRHVAGLEHEGNVPVCLAILGRISPAQLDDDARKTYEEVRRWSDDKTRRTRMEQLTARRQQKETRLARQMMRLRESGAVSDTTLMLFGISGEMPEQADYLRMTEDERRELWEGRMKQKFGPDWRRITGRRATFSFVREKNQGTWKETGF